MGVVVQTLDHTKAPDQRRRQESGAGRGADEGKRRKIEAQRSRGRPLADDHVDLEILHRGIEHLFDGPAKPVYLVDEQDIPRLKRGQDRGEIAFTFDHRPAGCVEADLELERDNPCQGGLPEARRTGQQHVIQGLFALLGCLEKDSQLLARGLLTDEGADVAGPQRAVEIRILGPLVRGGDARVVH